MDVGRFYLYLSSLPVAYLSDALRRRLLVTGVSARIKDETTDSSAWFFAQSHFAHSLSPNFSSHFALYRLAPYPFCPLPFCPIATSPNHLFAHLSFRPFTNLLFAESPNAISPLYHFAPSPFRPMSFCPFIISPLYHFITLFQFH